MRRRVSSNASTGDVESSSQRRTRKSEKEFVHYWKTFFVISCLAGFFIDPLFFFTLSVNQDYKCFFFNWTFAIGISAVRTVTDIVYLLQILIQFRLAYIALKSRFGTKDFIVEKKKAAKHSFRGHLFLDFFVILPLPQLDMLWAHAGTSLASRFFGGVEIVKCGLVWTRVCVLELR
ncbi:unnamed protein product [Spirodela intermedia]|nr:unnamed protein product [Spirodela intermedia]CAA6659354.1 unnamed protein product [Spirodela intermedia]